MPSSLEELALAKIARNLQKMGWMTGRSYDPAYDLLAYSPKHYRVCSIKVAAFDTSGKTREIELKRQLGPEELSGCSHAAVYVEPQGWIFIGPKGCMVHPSGLLLSVLSPTGTCLDEQDNPVSFGKYREAWEALLS